MMCKECDHARKNHSGKNGGLVYCVMFGIFISGQYKSCPRLINEVHEQVSESKVQLERDRV